MGIVICVVHGFTMSPSPGVFRKTGLTFAIGLTIGFIGTYVVINSSKTRESIPAERRGSSFSGHGFIPKSPHSHGEMDNVVGPDQQQSWHDFDHHHDEDVVAQDLLKKVKVLCWVMTSPSNIKSKAQHVKATWGKRCNKLLFMSSKPDSSLPAVGLNIEEGRENLWGKTKEAFKYVYENHYNEYDWFLKADDDTYVIMENLRNLLQDFDSSENIYLGHRFKPYVRQGYMSGGAGYVLSKTSLKTFVTKAMPDGEKCRYDAGGAEDMDTREVPSFLTRASSYTRFNT